MMEMRKNMNNQEIARLLQAISAAYEVKGENKFKIIAYDRAAVAVEHASSEIKDIWDDGKLLDLPGIGQGIAQHLDELFKKGSVSHFKQVLEKLPPSMFELLKISGIGPKTAYRLSLELNLKKPQEAIEDLINAAKNNKIAVLDGFGEKSQSDILEALEEYKKGSVKKKRMLLPYADMLAEEIINYLKRCSASLRIDSLGSLRRKVATVGDIDIAVATNEPQKVINWFVAFKNIKKVIEKGENKASVLLKSGQQVDLRVQSPEAYGAMIQYFIGSKHHNIHLREMALKKGYSLSEYGIKPVGKEQRAKGKGKNYNKKKNLFVFNNEEKFYSFLGLPWIPPELREDTGEIEASLGGKLPNLVKLSNIKGDLHVHSNFLLETSHDAGESSLKDMMEEAKRLDYEYLGFSEHNPSLSKHSEKQIENLLKMKKNNIDKLNYSSKKSTQNKKKGLVRLFNGLEIDIRPNGSLAIPENSLKLLDYVIASVHSSFNMSRKNMTERVLNALKYPKVRIFGHPTGRKIDQREGYELDWEKIFAFCLKKNIALEINAWPERLDLPDTLVREAVKIGVKMIISTDSHEQSQMSLIKFGVYVARRGWAQKNDIQNTLSYDKINSWLKGGEKEINK